MLVVDLVENLLIAQFFQSHPAPWAGCGSRRADLPNSAQPD